MIKKFSATLISGSLITALITALAVALPFSAFAATINSSNITVTTTSSGAVFSNTTSTSQTGGNTGGGGSGGSGGNGGSVSSSASGSSTSCTTEMTTVVSDATATFTGDDGSGNAVPVTMNATTNQYWTAVIPGATWIWGVAQTSNPLVNQTDTFTDNFNWSGTVTGVDLYVAGDNYYTVLVNGNNITGTTGTNTDQNFATATHYSVPAADINQGSNTLTVIGENEGVAGSTALSNPAGVLYKLVTTGQQCTSQNTGGGTGGKGGNGGSGGSGGVIITGPGMTKTTSFNMLNVTKTTIH